MRFGNTNSFRTSVAHFLKKKEFRKIFMTNLGLNSVEVNEFFNTNGEVLNFPRHQVINNCLLYQKYNINVESLKKFHYCLKMLNYQLEHRINVLKDLGVLELNSSRLRNITYLTKKNILEFKEEINIPVEQNITRNLFDKLGYDVPSQISELESSEKKLTIRQYYETCLLHCKTAVFDLPYLDNNILLNKYMRFKSISMIMDTLKILRIDLDYDKEMIKSYPFVITASADNIQMLLNEFTDICGIPIVMFLRKYPYILLQDADNIKRLLISIKRYEIPDEYIKNCINIFTIDNDTFLERMKKIKKNPYLNMWCKHPRFLQIVLSKHIVENRMKYFEIMNRSKWTRPQMILCSSNIEKFIQTGTSIRSPKTSLKYIFIKELEVDMTTLLKRHQHWKTVGFTDIEQMLQYLKKHFTISEICQNIHIVLYPQSKVEKTLTDLKRQYSQSTEYSFTGSQYLALCLYMLEKDTHFTGDGIWSNGHNVKQQSIEDENSTKRSDNDIDVNSSTKSDDIDHDTSDEDKTFHTIK